MYRSPFKHVPLLAILLGVTHSVFAANTGIGGKGEACLDLFCQGASAEPAAQQNQIILLPQADGTPSGVVVKQGGGAELLLDKPFETTSATTVSPDAPSPELKAEAADPAVIKSKYAKLFEIKPTDANTYIVNFDGLQPKDLKKAAFDAQIKAIVADAKSRSGGEIVIVGHTDTVGDDAKNDAISLLRAQVIRQYIVMEKFNPELIETLGFGEKYLKVNTLDNKPEPQNRVVEVLVR